MSASLLAICFSLAVAPDDAAEPRPGYVQQALERLVAEYEVLSFRLDLQLLEWRIQLQRAEFERQRALIYAQRRWVIEIPYRDIPDYAGPGRSRFELGDCDLLRRAERSPRR